VSKRKFYWIWMLLDFHACARPECAVVALFSACPFDLPSGCPFDENWHKWSTEQRHEVINFQGQRSRSYETKDKIKIRGLV